MEHGAFNLTWNVEELRRWQLCYSGRKIPEHAQLCNLDFPFLGVMVLLAVTVKVRGSCPHLSAPCSAAESLQSQ